MKNGILKKKWRKLINGNEALAAFHPADKNIENLSKLLRFDKNISITKPDVEARFLFIGINFLSCKPLFCSCITCTFSSRLTRRFSSCVNRKFFSRLTRRFFIFWNGTCAAWMIMLLSLERFVSIYLPITSRTWTTRRKVIVILIAVAALLCGVNLHHLWTYDLRQRWVTGSVSPLCCVLFHHLWMYDPRQSWVTVWVSPLCGVLLHHLWMYDPRQSWVTVWVSPLCGVLLHHLWMYDLRQRWVTGWVRLMLWQYVIMTPKISNDFV